MKPSITSRITKIQLLTVTILIVFLTSTSIFFTFHLKQALLIQDFEEEESFMLNYYGNDKQLIHHSQYIIIEYYPKNLKSNTLRHPVFKKIQVGDQKNISFNHSQYWVTASGTQDGIFYYARNLSSLKSWEHKYLLLDVILALFTLLLAIIISKATSKKLLGQLSRFTKIVKATEINKSIKKINLDYPDQETTDLATTFNSFLSELEKFITRERTLMELASHELRTPTSVILGAAWK